MDKVFVLDEGTLTDVNQLGGLDHYLAKLEGIEQERVEEEIQQDEASVSPEELAALYQDYMSIQNPSDELENIDKIVEMVDSQSVTQTPPQEVATPQEPVTPWQPEETPQKQDPTPQTKPKTEDDDTDTDVTVQQH